MDRPAPRVCDAVDPAAAIAGGGGRRLPVGRGKARVGLLDGGPLRPVVDEEGVWVIGALRRAQAGEEFGAQVGATIVQRGRGRGAACRPPVGEIGHGRRRRSRKAGQVELAGDVDEGLRLRGDAQPHLVDEKDTDAVADDQQRHQLDADQTHGKRSPCGGEVEIGDEDRGAGQDRAGADEQRLGLLVEQAGACGQGANGRQRAQQRAETEHPVRPCVAGPRAEQDRQLLAQPCARGERRGAFVELQHAAHEGDEHQQNAEGHQIVDLPRRPAPGIRRQEERDCPGQRSPKCGDGQCKESGQRPFHLLRRPLFGEDGGKLHQRHTAQQHKGVA